MLDHMSRRSRSVLSLSLTSLALALSVLAFSTSYWCEGTHKVVKPLCLSPVKMKNCGSNNSEPFTTEKPTGDPRNESSVPVSTVSPKRREELLKIRQRQLANAVHYIWETGEDKYAFLYFHTGFWESCEKHTHGEQCRSFIELTPGETQGVLWLSVVSEIAYISLLAMGFLLMWLEVLCFRKEMRALKINAFAAICTALSGLVGMVAHMMYTTVFQVTVSVGPKDWRPQTWDYGWSFILAWISFSCCMAAAVFTLNSYTKTLIELRHRQRLRLEEARASHAPSYNEVVPGGGVYSINGALPCPNAAWVRDGVRVGVGVGLGDAAMVMMEGSGPYRCEDCEREDEYEDCEGEEGCEDCEREMEEMEEAAEREKGHSPC
ncbi:germ cell-specific gene 1-like protein [Megalops cyprinoides]|uniref:germ cell-specific gene 1-like protein n=1 Tax=Megalops cyprinoides TaxID=118141 RepID=UPI0018655D98|nr:germ cell-specific gene 1-like protein [Megalops cyprinoides]